MVSLIDLVKLLKANITGTAFYPLEFPLNSPIDSCVVDVFGTGTVTAGNFNMNVQVKVRAEHPATAEVVCNEINEFLDKKTNYSLGTMQVVMSETNNRIPLPMGKDSNGNYLYSMNFRFIINEGV